MADIFDRLDGKDGFHVICLDSGVDLSLHCQAYGGGELYNLSDPMNPESTTVTIRQWMGPSDEDRGECTRLHLVAEAIARYLTTGGTWEELTDTVKAMRKVALNGIAFDGYYIQDSYITTEFVYQHIFVKEGEIDANGERPARLWEEPTYDVRGGLVGGFISPSTLEEIVRQQEDDPNIWRTGESAGTAGPTSRAIRPSVSLLGIKDLPSEEGTVGGPG
jgi:hypothetical protein